MKTSDSKLSISNTSNQTDTLPLIITPNKPDTKLSQWYQDNKDEISPLLSKHGALLFRDFDLKDVNDFKSFVDVLDSSPIPYMFRSSPRSEIDHAIKNIYHSTSYHNEYHILLHNESSYSRNWGMKIIFCCLKPALKGGETPIADSRKIFQSLPESLQIKFKEKGVLYKRKLKKRYGMSWQEVFQTEDKEEVAAICIKNDIKFEFLNDDEVNLKWHKPAIYNHPNSNEYTWFNHVYFFNKYSRYKELELDYGDDMPEDFIINNTFFGDGTEISLEEYLTIQKAYNDNTIAFPYQKGDVLFIDNMLVCHGRNPYEGDRTIATAIVEPFGDDLY